MAKHVYLAPGEEWSWSLDGELIVVVHAPDPIPEQEPKRCYICSRGIMTIQDHEVAAEPDGSMQRVCPLCYRIFTGSLWQANKMKWFYEAGREQGDTEGQERPAERP